MFKFIDRKQNRHLVLFSGWAFDHRIFQLMDLPYNYIFYCSESLADFEGELKKVLDTNSIDKISLLGWSQGAFIACNFAGSCPAVIEEIILAGARQKYDKDGLEKIKQYLTKNKTAYLYSFYKECFGPCEKDLYRRFKDTLLKNYLEEFSLEQLIKGLDRIGRAKIDVNSLKEIENIKIVHGRADSIAPVDEAVQLSKSLPQSQLIVFDEAGHLPFLQKDFKKRLYEY